MNWINKLFHRHEMIWTSRKVLGYTTIDYTTGGIVDIEDATKYLYKGYCAVCNGNFKEIRTIAKVLDRKQPYDYEA